MFLPRSAGRRVRKPRQPMSSPCRLWSSAHCFIKLRIRHRHLVVVGGSDLPFGPGVGGIGMPKFFRTSASGFSSRRAVPSDPGQAADWQAANRDWWTSHPMSYEWEEGHPAAVGSRAYFDAIDRTFFASARTYLGQVDPPFAALIPYDDLSAMDVLEVGVGAGSHAALLALHARSFTGIDLTDTAVALTQQRFEVCGLAGEIRQMDAEELEFADDSFDFIWSWGVIHHSAKTRQILREMKRVLRPDGRAVIMVYHRSFWWYYVVCGVLHGAFRG